MIELPQAPWVLRRNEATGGIEAIVDFDGNNVISGNFDYDIIFASPDVQSAVLFLPLLITVIEAGEFYHTATEAFRVTTGAYQEAALLQSSEAHGAMLQAHRDWRRKTTAVLTAMSDAIAAARSEAEKAAARAKQSWMTRDGRTVPCALVNGVWTEIEETTDGPRTV